MLGLMVSVGGCGKEIEVVKETQPLTGKIVEEYEAYRDEKSNKPVKHGYYKSYYEDGSYKDVGQYEDGKKVGEWSHREVFYDNDGQIKFEINQKDGKTLNQINYYKDGQIKSKENYKDEKLDGKSFAYDKEGNITAEACFDMGTKVDCP